MSADDKFVEQHSSFVRCIAATVKESLSLDTGLDDLVASGFRGLLEARQRFDASKGIGFRSFAYYRVRGAILDSVRKAGYLPRRAHARLKAAEVLNAQSESALLIRAATPQISSDIAASIRAIDAILGRVAAAYSLSAAAAENETSGDTPESDLIYGEEIQFVVQAIDTLPERERVLMQGHYLEERTLEELAKELGISKSWASRLHSKALDTLRETLNTV